MLSTPLICCSIGVATAFSTVSASAPTYVVSITISGGTMFGNCATGRPSIATAPMITMMIEITIATIGRSMKNRATGGYLPSGAGAAVAEAAAGAGALPDG